MNSIAAIVAPFIAFPLSMVAAIVVGFVVGVMASAIFGGNINLIVEILVGISMFGTMIAAWLLIAAGIENG